MVCYCSPELNECDIGNIAKIIKHRKYVPFLNEPHSQMKEHNHEYDYLKGVNGKIKSRTLRSFVFIFGDFMMYSIVTIGTRHIILYRATASLRRPQIKQYTTSYEGGGVN